MSTPIGSQDKKELADMIKENDSFAKWYELNHAKADADMLAKAQKEIGELSKLKKEMSVLTKKNRDASNVLSKKQDEESRALTKKHEAETDVIYQARKKSEKVVSDKMNKIQNKLLKSGLQESSRYNSDDEEEYSWKVDKNRYDNEYHTWLRELRMDMITCLTIEDAKEIKKQFLMR
jgi:hypothetical protein